MSPLRFAETAPVANDRTPPPRPPAHRRRLIFLPGLLLLAVGLQAADPAVSPAPGEVTVTIKTLAARMKYDTSEFIVPPGARVRLTLVNEDAMPHNLIVSRPANDRGLSLAQTAWALGAQGVAKHWIPNDPRVLAATRTVPPHGREEIVFDAPRELGNYPYVCTFPGHAMLMNGVMRVAASGPRLTDARYQLFLGQWTRLPDFGTLKPAAGGTLTNDLLDLPPGAPAGNYGLRLTGQLRAPADGLYLFRLASDDGARLSIDGKVIVDHDGIHPPDEGRTASLRLKAGLHPLQVDYFQGGGGAELYVSWRGPGFSETWLSRGQLGPRYRRGPNDGETGIPLVVGDEAIIYRNFIAGMGTRGIAVGYPGGVNAAFDADLCNVALVWRGAFIDAKRHWTDRGVGAQPPLGYGVINLDRNVPLAVLAAPDSPWPAAPKDVPNGDWPAGYRFGGYALGRQGIPTFRYTFQGVSVEDHLAAATATGDHAGNAHAHDHAGATLQRVITLRSAKPVAGLTLRLAAGPRLATGRDGVYSLDEGITLTAPGSVLRRSAGLPEVLVPVAFTDGTARIEVRYTWNH